MEAGNMKFPAFPYKPYSIQMEFMNALYQSLDNGGVSMLESPTGTGKTLSIICSSLQWLVDQRYKQKVQSEANSNHNDAPGSDVDPDWLKNFAIDKDKSGKEINANKNEIMFPSSKSIQRNRRTCKDSLELNVKEDFYKQKECTDLHNNNALQINDEEFLMEDYESENEGNPGGCKSKRKANGVSFSSSSDDEEDDGGFLDAEEDENKLKIYFCSRTHSQLSQFVKELRMTVFASKIKVVCLGSRKSFCINEEVMKLGSSTHINERCLELQKKKKTKVSKVKDIGDGVGLRRTKASPGCPMLRKPKLQKQFKSEVTQAGALDIEDLIQFGRRIGTCPYYGSRSMVASADLVVLPYQSLLCKSSRESLGLVLKNNIIIIDEAHNLADSLISMYDSKITLSQLDRIHSHLERYFGRFCNILGPANRRYIQTLMVLTRAFLGVLHEENEASYASPSQATDKAYDEEDAFSSSMAINDFLFSLNVDNINLVKLLRYIKESNIIHKVSGYGDTVSSLQKDFVTSNDWQSSQEGSAVSAFRALADMILSLTNSDTDGRIIISRTRRTLSEQKGGYLKYVMLTGEKLFSEIVNQAHAVILAGGTLQPIEETRERLFSWLQPHELHFFSCGHIVPPSSILPVSVSSGPSGHTFDFSYASRNSPAMIEELGLLLCNLVTVVPEGIIVFFSSFDYEGRVYDSWKASGILERIMKKKLIFREPRRNTDVVGVLKEYRETIDTLSCSSLEGNKMPHNGAILLAIVGGKISEGINFSDGMGRCIIMVGLPYANPSDIELIERVKHIEGLGDSNHGAAPKLSNNSTTNGSAHAGFEILRSCKHRGKDYYENLCMKAVNQSIGRAIRHINDYAAILLVDKRYTNDSSKQNFSNPTSKLPKWIKNRLVPATNSYGEIHRMLHQFFKLNRMRLCVQGSS